MKTFRAIKDKPRRRAICRALNKLFWKTPQWPHANNATKANFWVAELQDVDIPIQWDPKAEEFTV